MRHLIALLIALGTMVPTTVSAWELKITRPELAGPFMLVCTQPNALINNVRSLTRNQIIGIQAAASDGELVQHCADQQLPVNIHFTGHARWLQTEDNFWILGRTAVMPNGFNVVVADPGVFAYQRKPPEFRMRYVINSDGVIYERIN